MNTANEAYQQLWNNRYGNANYAYGKIPNSFFKEHLEQLPAGNILLPAEGEGRNAVFAATKGWNVTAFDWSEKGKEKAGKLAEECNVSINYQVADFEELDFEDGAFDVIGLIYAHFMADKKALLHTKMNTYLKKGGTIIFEAFSKKNLPLVKANPKVGGAMEEDMLFSTEEIKAIFSNYEIILLEEIEAELKEGIYHNGTGAIIRFLARKL